MAHDVVEVLYSPNREAYVEIFRRQNGTFGFVELAFLSLEQVWAPCGRYSETVVDSPDAAIREAKGRAAWLSEALRPGVYTLSWIRNLAEDPSAHFISPNIPVYVEASSEPDRSSGRGEKLIPRSILRVGDLYLVETVDRSDEWFMGSRDGDGPILCWGNYGNLEDAIKGL